LTLGVSVIGLVTFRSTGLVCCASADAAALSRIPLRVINTN
jgi:hypothetical protein